MRIASSTRMRQYPLFDGSQILSKSLRTLREERLFLSPGDIYWDCAYHPVLCTQVDGDDVEGISLFDGSSPRSCSIYRCAVQPLNGAQVVELMQHKDEFLTAEEVFHKTLDSSGYMNIFKRLKEIPTTTAKV